MVSTSPGSAPADSSSVRPPQDRWTTFAQAVGRQMYTRRLGLGWSLADLAARISAQDDARPLAVATLARHERDGDMNVGVAERMCRALRVDLNALADRAWRATIGLDHGNPIIVDLTSLASSADPRFTALHDWAATWSASDRFALVNRDIAQALADLCGVPDHELRIALLRHIGSDITDPCR